MFTLFERLSILLTLKNVQNNVSEKNGNDLTKQLNLLWP